jgi:lipopolysaccharide export system protein LptA
MMSNRLFSRSDQQYGSLLLLLTIFLCLPGNNAWAKKSDREQPVELAADQSEFDADTGFTLITGNVVIEQGTLEIHSDEARVFMQDGRMSRILLDGAPATWRQQLESGQWMDAESLQIDYDVNAEQILLIGDAVVDHPQGEITGDRISYDLAAEKLRGDSSNGGRIRMRIEPDVVENESGNTADNNNDEQLADDSDADS